MARISIQIGGHLCTAPRPVKEAGFLAGAGHQVTITGVWFDDALAQLDQHLIGNAPWRFVTATDLRPGSPAAFRVRALAAFHRRLFQATGRFSPRLLGLAAPELLQTLKAQAADLTIVHSESGLWAASKLRRAGLRVGVDFEDWFSRDLPVEERRGRPVDHLEQLESELCSNACYRLATSEAMAEHMADYFGSSPPAVLYNAFSFAERATIDGATRDRPMRDALSFHWFSQTIGPGRGLETLLAALPRCRSHFEVHLRGSVPAHYRDWLDGQVTDEIRHRVKVHASVRADQLLSRIAEHDVGLALETDQIINKDLTVSNKLFQYFQAGLAVIATRTRGQTEVMNQVPSAGLLIPCDDVSALAIALDEMAENAEFRESARRGALAAAKRFDIDQSRGRIIALAEQALAET